MLKVWLLAGLCFWGGCASAPSEKGMAESQGLKTATFAAGCFWGMEKIFAATPGVVETEVGYTGGAAENPSYEEVCTGATGHAEAVQVRYDPERVSYEELLAIFWEWHDPTTLNRQGPDVGTQYRSAIFTHDDRQRETALICREALEESGVYGAPIVTEIVPAGPFYPAEEHHQDYLKKNPFGYCSHTLISPRVRQILRKRLSALAGRKAG